MATVVESDPKVTVVESDPKAPFSFLWIASLYPYLIILSTKQGRIKYHFWVFCMTRPGIEPRSPMPLVNTLTNMPKYQFKNKFRIISPYLLSSIIKLYNANKCVITSRIIYLYNVYPELLSTVINLYKVNLCVCPHFLSCIIDLCNVNLCVCPHLSSITNYVL